MKKEVIEKIATLSAAAFGFVAALAWNTAIQATFKNIFGELSSLWAMFGYAVIVTLIAVVVTLWIGKISSKMNNRK